MKKTAIILCILSMGLIGQSAFAAGGLQMNNYAEVLVQNLQIGSSYSMIELVNLPLEIVNQSDEAVDIEISVAKPAKAKKGFEPVPAAGWVSIAPPKATIPARGTYKTDVRISIPDDNKYLGKKYEASILARVVPKAKGIVAIALAVQGRLLFTVATAKQAETGAPKIDMDFSLTPLRVDLKDVKLGKKQEVLVPKQGPVVLQNSSKKETTFILQSLDPKDTVVTIEPGFEATPSADWLTFEKEELTLRGGQKHPLKMFVEIPNKPEYAGKSFEFVVCATTGAATAGKRYLRVLVTTVK